MAPSTTESTTGDRPSDKTIAISDVLTLEEIGKSNSRAQIDGIAAGLASGSISAILASRFRLLSPNHSALVGFGVGIFIGYYYSRRALSSNLDRYARNKRLGKQDASASKADSKVMRDPY